MTSPPERVPILRLWNRLLVALQGDITDNLAERLSDEVLATIHAEGADGLVLDVTGVWTMDSHLCAVLSRLAQSASLMGTTTIITGLSSEIAQTLQAMGIELEVKTALSVEQALEMLGVEVKLAAPKPRFVARSSNLIGNRRWETRSHASRLGDFTNE
jgi:rsbT antagonist protein RsbS